jgi:ABC-type transport system involved in multi-copper enzyme maturation permease subunit
MTRRDEGRTISFAAGVRAVLRLSLAGGAWMRRSLLVAALLGLPVVLGLLVHWLGPSPRPSPTMGAGLFDQVITYYYLLAALPLVALFSAGSLIADELEGRTITYLFTRPVSRASILCGKLASYALAALTFALPAIVLSFLVLLSLDGLAAIGEHAGDLARALGVTVLALLAYGSLFALAGILFRRPLVLGIGLFAWERLVSWLGPGQLSRLTLSTHLGALLEPQPPVAMSLAILLTATLVFVLAAAFIFARREYVLDQ